MRARVGALGSSACVDVEVWRGHNLPHVQAAKGAKQARLELHALVAAARQRRDLSMYDAIVLRQQLGALRWGLGHSVQCGGWQMQFGQPVVG